MPGSRRQVGKGRWLLRVNTIPGPDGKRRQIARRFEGSARAADRALADLLREVEDEQRVPESTMTLGQLLDQYLDHLTALGRSPATIAGYQNWRRRELGEIEKVRIAKVTALQIDTLYRRLLREGKAPASIHQIHTLLAGAFKQAVKWGLVNDTPVRLATKPTVPAPDPQAPPPAAVRAVLAAAAEHSLEIGVFVRLAAVTGCRRGELVALQDADVDLDRSVVTIERSAGATRDTGTYVKSTKTHQRDVLPLDPETVAAVAAFRAELDERAAACGVTRSPQAFLFSHDPDGANCWHPDTASGVFARVVKAAGAGPMTLRDLRHFVGTQVLDVTGSVKAAQKRLRHRNPSTTLTFYTAKVDGRDWEAAAAMADVLRPPADST